MFVHMKNFKNIMDLVQFFNTEEKCYDFLKLMLWVNGKECPFCGGSRINEYKSNFKKNRCYSCKKDFSIRKNTIFDNSKISLQKWFMCIYLINSNKKGISSLQLSRQVGITQKSAWFVLHRIRKACKTNAFKQSVKSTMEVDEAYIGGLEKNRHMYDRLKGLKKKSIVFGIINRDTKQVRAMCIKDVTSITLVNKIKNNVKEGSVIITDELKGYCRLDGYNHKSVSHGKNEYVKKDNFDS